MGVKVSCEEKWQMLEKFTKWRFNIFVGLCYFYKLQTSKYVMICINPLAWLWKLLLHYKISLELRVHYISVVS